MRKSKRERQKHCSHRLFMVMISCRSCCFCQSLMRTSGSVFTSRKRDIEITFGCTPHPVPIHPTLFSGKAKRLHLVFIALLPNQVESVSTRLCSDERVAPKFRKILWLRKKNRFLLKNADELETFSCQRLHRSSDAPSTI